jgi:hypothetical protein
MVQTVRQLYGKIPSTIIAEMLGVPRHTVINIASKYGLQAKFGSLEHRMRQSRMGKINYGRSQKLREQVLQNVFKGWVKTEERRIQISNSIKEHDEICKIIASVLAERGYTVCPMDIKPDLIVKDKDGKVYGLEVITGKFAPRGVKIAKYADALRKSKFFDDIVFLFVEKAPSQPPERTIT